MSSINTNQRVNFASIKNPLPYPDFLEVQLKSFRDFLQLDTPPEKRKKEGLYKQLAWTADTLAFVADEAIQIHGGMGLMDELPLERIWRDARVERIWEGTSEIQRHIISRALLRAVGG